MVLAVSESLPLLDSKATHQIFPLFENRVANVAFLAAIVLVVRTLHDHIARTSGGLRIEKVVFEALKTFHGLGVDLHAVRVYGVVREDARSPQNAVFLVLTQDVLRLALLAKIGDVREQAVLRLALVRGVQFEARLANGAFYLPVSQIEGDLAILQRAEHAGDLLLLFDLFDKHHLFGAVQVQTLVTRQSRHQLAQVAFLREPKGSIAAFNRNAPFYKQNIQNFFVLTRKKFPALYTARRELRRVIQHHVQVLLALGVRSQRFFETVVYFDALDRLHFHDLRPQVKVVAHNDVYFAVPPTWNILGEAFLADSAKVLFKHQTASDDLRLAMQAVTRARKAILTLDAQVVVVLGAVGDQVQSSDVLANAIHGVLPIVAKNAHSLLIVDQTVVISWNAETFAAHLLQKISFFANLALVVDALLKTVLHRVLNVFHAIEVYLSVARLALVAKKFLLVVVVPLLAVVVQTLALIVDEYVRIVQALQNFSVHAVSGIHVALLYTVALDLPQAVARLAFAAGRILLVAVHNRLCFAEIRRIERIPRFAEITFVLVQKNLAKFYRSLQASALNRVEKMLILALRAGDLSRDISSILDAFVHLHCGVATAGEQHEGGVALSTLVFLGVQNFAVQIFCINHAFFVGKVKFR